MQRSSDTKTSNRLPDALLPESFELLQSHSEPFALVLAERMPPAEHVSRPVAGLIGSRDDEERHLRRDRYDRPRGDVQRFCHSQRPYAVPDGPGAALATIPQDAELISLTEDYEIAYWRKRLGVSDDRLAEAVHRVGLLAADVEAHLKT